MYFWLLLAFLGLFTYLVVQRTVSSITRTPVWLLWLVLMTPAFVWALWVLLYGENRPLPGIIVITTCLLCPILYWILIQAGRDTSEEKVEYSTQPKTPTYNVNPVRPINQAEETILRNCFPLSVYHLQQLEYRPQAVICRGKLRTIPDQAYQIVRDNITQHFGDRFFLIFQEGNTGTHLFALVPNPQSTKEGQNPPSDNITQPGIALILLLITLLTTTYIGAKFMLDAKELSDNPQLITRGLPYAIGLMTILGIHELGHYITAIAYRLRATLPYFIPIPFFLGTLGAFIQVRSPMPHRKALFDVGVAGPIAGLLITIPLLWWGLLHSEIVPLVQKSSLLYIDAMNPRGSLFLTLFCKLVLGDLLVKGMGINLHPVAIAAYIGLIATAFNLMPIGQLDGGHIVHAMYGQRTAIVVSQITRFLMLGLSFIQPEFLIWAIILLFIPIVDEPALNDVTELDNIRDIIGLSSLALLVLIVLPSPLLVLQILNI